MRIKLFLSCLALTVSAHAQTGPKVVFTGDEFTYNWQQSDAFKANKNWIGAGLPGTQSFSLSSQVAADFQTVLNQHPAFVFIDTGASDISWNTDSNPFGFEWESAADSIIQMVQMAQKADVKVILGNLVVGGPTAGGYGQFESDHFNGWLQAFAQSENIPIVNFQNALENGPNEPNAICEPCSNVTLVTPASGAPFTIQVPTEAGYQLITQMAQTAIATYGLTIKGGYLNDVQAVSGTYGNDPTPLQPSVNEVTSGAGVQFTPQATWSDGVTRSMLNTPYGGALGTWWSTNPKVMAVNQQGLAYAYSSGTATIWFKSASGHTFSPWTMTVGAQPQSSEPQY